MSRKRYEKKWNDQAAEAAVRVFRATANRARAAEAAGVVKKTLEYHYYRDEEFRAQMDHAKALYVQDLEQEALRRAVEGVEDFRGTTPIRRYSDSLLLHLLKRKDPDQHGDRMRVDQTTEHKGGIQLDVTRLSKGSRQDLRRILERERDSE